MNVGCFSYISGYNQYNQNMLDESSELYSFSPDLTFLILDIRSILGDVFYYPHSLNSTQRNDLIIKITDDLKNMIRSFTNKTKSKLIISNFIIPTYSSYGILDSKMDHGLKSTINEINSNLENFIKTQQSVYSFDLNGFITKHGENNVFDYHKYFFGDIRISFEYLPHLANDLLGYVKAFLGLSKKCIVLDLDNTLWGGIVGEDGFDGISLGPTPPGNAFVEFQKRILALHQRGIILAINSKNNFDDAIQVIKNHPYMILRETHFASVKINWIDKVSNMKNIASELNIGLDSMVFLDDDQANRELIRMQIPQILTVDIGNDPAMYSPILMSLNDFDLLQITEDDIKRGEMYLEEKNRKILMESTNLDDFLKQLEIKTEIKKVDQFSLPRISQLTLKTNQFNLTTKRYQEEDIRKFSQDQKMLVCGTKVEDKFGDNGITGVYIVKKNNPEEWFVDTFLLSCRVIGREIEDIMMANILRQAKMEGVKKVKAQFIPTQKNQPASNFLSSYGFTLEGDYWVFPLENEIKTPKHIKDVST
jgi:FkbH-like protein